MKVECADLVGLSFEDINCWQLVQKIYARAQVCLQGYTIGVDECKLISKIYERELDQDFSTAWKKLEVPEEGCLIAIRNHPKYISHCGVYIGAGKFIHSLAGCGVVVSRVSDKSWDKKIAGYYRYVG